jgi:alcohol dehydrogenase (cytochrome c)
VSENLLVDAPVNGKPMKLAITADRNGFGYAVDRTNGKFVWGTPFVKKVTWTRGLDQETGKPAEYDPSKPVQTYSTTPGANSKVTDICPGNMGGKNWPPTAYNPNLHLWYIPVIESCNTITWEETKPGAWKPREFYTGGGPSEHQRITGSVTAIDVTTGKVAGKAETPFPMLGGLLATPDLVFTGTPDGDVMALDAKSLEKVWSFNTGSGVNAPPMTFTVDGKQYIAILVGLGGAWDKWFIEATPELKSQSPSSMLYVFAL